MDIFAGMAVLGTGLLFAVAVVGFAAYKGLGASTANGVAWLLGYLSLAWGLLLPVLVTLGAGTGEAAAFSLLLVLLWIVPIGGALMLWARPGTGAVIAIAAIYLYWTLVSSIAYIGIWYFPAAITLWLGTVLRLLSRTEATSPANGQAFSDTVSGMAIKRSPRRGGGRRNRSRKAKDDGFMRLEGFHLGDDS